jgi:ethanolamine utilization protein EutQ (cupin superfamily)
MFWISGDNSVDDLDIVLAARVAIRDDEQDVLARPPDIEAVGFTVVSELIHKQAVFPETRQRPAQVSRSSR